MSEAQTPKQDYHVLARYSAMRHIGSFSTQIRNLGFGEKCILRTERGTEWGEAISEIERTDAEPAMRFEGTVLRRVTPKDYERRQSLEDVEQPKEFAFCTNKIKVLELPMRLVSVEHIFGGEKIIFYFMADGRVDFRQLVKDLATEYRTRIELRQIGVRDEARLLAEYEHCGRELCCRTFIKDLEPVTMRMAKLQKTTLDPTKISGRCGRLMCCLRFEDEAYADLKSRLPKKGTRVKISEGVGDVVSSEILAQKVTIELPDHKLVTVALADILETLPGAPPPPEKASPPGGPAQGPDEDRQGGRRRPGRNRRRRDQGSAEGQEDRRTDSSTEGRQNAPPQAPQDDKPQTAPGGRAPDAPRNAAAASNTPQAPSSRDQEQSSPATTEASQAPQDDKVPAEEPRLGVPDESTGGQPAPPEKPPDGKSPVNDAPTPPPKANEGWPADEWWEGPDDTEE